MLSRGSNQSDGQAEARPTPHRNGPTLGAHRVLELLSGLERRGLAGRNLDLFTRLWVAPLASGALAHLEGAETDNRDLLAAIQSLTDDVDEGVHSLFALLLAEARAIRDTGNQVIFVRTNPPLLS